MSYVTYRYRVKNAKNLPNLAKAVNLVWNYCGDIHNQTTRRRRQWLTGFDLCKLVAGATEALGIHNATLQDVAIQFARARDRAKRRPRWRTSAGSRRSLGWIPFRDARAIKIVGSTVRYRGVHYPIWLHRPICGRIVYGSFAEDAQGRWYVNLTCEVVDASPKPNHAPIGIDLGLKTLAVLSNGAKFVGAKATAQEAQKLATAQCANRRKRVRAIHAKIGNQRHHYLHLLSATIVARFSAIYVGNVGAQGLLQTRLAKSVADASWTTFRNMLRYKAIRHGVKFAEVDERFTTQTCSACLARSGPRGLEGLEVREWQCSNCGAHHDRDVNAAKNILFLGQSADLHETGSSST